MFSWRLLFILKAIAQNEIKKKQRIECYKRYMLVVESRKNFQQPQQSIIMLLLHIIDRYSVMIFSQWLSILLFMSSTHIQFLRFTFVRTSSAFVHFLTRLFVFLSLTLCQTLIVHFVLVYCQFSLLRCC